MWLKKITILGFNENYKTFCCFVANASYLRMLHTMICELSTSMASFCRFHEMICIRDQSSLNGWRGWVLEVLGGYHILFRGKRRGIKYKSFSLTLLLLFRNPLQSTSMWCLRPILQKITKRVSTEQELMISWWRIEECSGLSYLR